jgi:hypothetical protein
LIMDSEQQQPAVDSEPGTFVDVVHCPPSTVNCPSVLRVWPGADFTGPSGLPARTFSVVLDRPANGELGVVATAVDPNDPAARIPAVGEPHPTMPGFVARPPEIHPVGLRGKGGAIVARETCFYNVVTRYQKKASDLRPQTSGAEEKAAQAPGEAFVVPGVCSLKPEACCPEGSAV